MIKPISISLSPNTEKDDILLAFRLLFQPWRWKKGKATEALEEAFREYSGARYVFSFNSGRSSLLAILHALGLQKGDEVLLQAFTCNAVPNPVLWAGFKPVYVDCSEDDFNIDIADLKGKITSQSKVVIVQHTFGKPADIDAIAEICQKHNLILVEDCAHALGAKYQERLVGTFGKAAFFSFSRDKVISSVYGGMVVTNDDQLAKNIQTFQQGINHPSLYWIFQQLLHPVLMNWIILPTYEIFGKYLLIVFQWLQILSKAVHWKEKRGKMPGYFPRRMPNALAALALHQFRKLERFNKYRKEVAEFYSQALTNTSYKILDTQYQHDSMFLRFPVKYLKAHDIIKKAWAHNFLIGDWYTTPIAPHDTKVDTMQYVQGSCPVAERLARTTFNLPTHINVSKLDAQRIVDFLKSQT